MADIKGIFWQKLMNLSIQLNAKTIQITFDADQESL
jgi:hypothetical protein